MCDASQTTRPTKKTSINVPHTFRTHMSINISTVNGLSTKYIAERMHISVRKTIIIECGVCVFRAIIIITRRRAADCGCCRACVRSYMYVCSSGCICQGKRHTWETNGSDVNDIKYTVSHKYNDVAAHRIAINRRNRRCACSYN